MSERQAIPTLRTISICRRQAIPGRKAIPVPEEPSLASSQLYQISKSREANVSFLLIAAALSEGMANSEIVLPIFSETNMPSIGKLREVSCLPHAKFPPAAVSCPPGSSLARKRVIRNPISKERKPVRNVPFAKLPTSQNYCPGRLQTEPASARRREVVQAQGAAEHALSYIERMYANWIPSSNLTDPAIVRDMRKASIASVGKRLIDQARCVILRFDRFIAANRSRIAESEDGCVEYSIDLVQWFISDASVEAAAKRKETSRGEAGKGLLKALSAAARILFFPAGAGVLEAHSVLSAAVVRPHAKAKKVEAHASVEVMLSLHDLSGKFTSRHEQHSWGPSSYLGYISRSLHFCFVESPHAGPNSVILH